MRTTRRPIVIASRRSPLAQAQAQAVGRSLAQAWPGLTIQYHWVVSEGDQRAATPLDQAGGKGLFARAVEQALINHEADLAIHSLKDLPTHDPAPGLLIAAVPPRTDPRDGLLSRHGPSLDQLPPNAVLGTASPRRAAQAKRLRPDLQIKLIRGNVQTRINKVIQAKQYDATLLAMAGVQRLGIDQAMIHPLDPAVMLPAAGQGALAIQCRGDDHATLRRCLPLNDPLTAAAVNAERQITAALQGDCHSPIAAFAQPHDQPVAVGAATGFRFRVRVLSPDGQACAQADQCAHTSQLNHLVKPVLAQLRAAGCQQLLPNP